MEERRPAALRVGESGSGQEGDGEEEKKGFH